MSDESRTIEVTLAPPRGEPIPGRVTFTAVPAWQRGVKSGGLLALGLVLAVPAVAVPPHFVVSAGVFGVAALGAYAVWDRGVFVRSVGFRCACGAEADATDVGQWTADTWVRCPACAAPWRLGTPPT